MTTPTEPTDPAFPTLLAKMQAQYPGLKPTIDPSTLLGRILAQGGPQA